jgi:CHAD domain-containing protein
VGVEREVKLGAWAGLIVPDLTDIVPDGSVLNLTPQRLIANYYDTSDLRLARWGITIRHRAEDGSDARTSGTWTLKLPEQARGPGLVRREHNVDGSDGRIPAGLLHLVRAYARMATLVPIARLRTDRMRSQVRDADGRCMVEIDDDEVSVLVPGANGRGRRIAARFREIEIELGPAGTIAVLDLVVDRFRAAGAGPPDPTPKVVRALGPLAVEPPELVVPPVGPRSPTEDVVRAALANGVERLMAHDPGVRLGDDPEDVHQARVATRRLRSDLRTFRELLDPEWTAAQRAELGWLAGLLGAVRDADVLLDRLRSEVATLDPADARPAAALLRRLVLEREAARVELLAALDSPRYAETLDTLVQAAREPRFVTETPADSPVAEQVTTATEPARDVVPRLVKRPWRHLRKAVTDLDPDPPDEALHRVRILAKRCRYAAEAAIPVAGKDARRFADAVGALQTVLGDCNDAVVAERWLRTAVAKGPATRGTAVVAGQLIAAERARAADCRKAWRAVWRRTSTKRMRSWLGEE